MGISLSMIRSIDRRVPHIEADLVFPLALFALSVKVGRSGCPLALERRNV